MGKFSYVGCSYGVSNGRVSSTEKIGNIVQYIVAAVINTLKRYTMEKDRFLLIHMDKNVRRFKSIASAINYTKKYCRGNYEFYVIVDTEEDKVVCKWSY